MGVDQPARDPGGPELPEDAAGRRVSCDGERATVRYVGPVPPTEGLWLGVEWDKPERGKHDGSHNGVQYFTCRHPTGGSFLRPAKVSFGVDYVTVVREQYGLDVQAVLSEKLCVSSRTVEWSRLRAPRLDDLTSVSVDNREVNGPGNVDEIQQTTGNVQSLDLGRNLLSSWDDVAAITAQMDKLEELLLSDNRLRLPSDPCTQSHAFSSLKVLALNSCALTWPQILHCAPMWPQLEELCVSQNDITELQRPVDVLQSLKSLDVSINPLVEETVLSLAALPRLEKLNLAKTGLSSLRFDDAPPGGKTAMFPSLQYLILDNNSSITEWGVVDELAKLQSLVELSCRCSGLTSSDGKLQTVNQLFIAKLGQLEHLNRLEILPEDRRGAELDYIKMFGEEWLKAGGHPDAQQSQPSTQFTSQHPRYLSLIHKYGAPEEGELKKQQPFALKNHLIKVTFVFPDQADRKPIEKKLPVSMLVQKVKGLLYRLLKVPAAELKLTYTSCKIEGKEIEIDSDLKPLGFYSIEEGDQVLVRWS
ncbi:tubulin-specific chaperone E [Myripristis murdjan]|uniref:Tubulin-specific chaperone E n=1 Tax=Myripristis murdjan TaxID=586833 RepID=A0A667XBW9_9TELE|nr:tubulin-specific chaperone E [Myripristis murdjan]